MRKYSLTSITEQLQTLFSDHFENLLVELQNFEGDHKEVFEICQAKKFVCLVQQVVRYLSEDDKMLAEEILYSALGVPEVLDETTHLISHLFFYSEIEDNQTFFERSEK